MKALLAEQSGGGGTWDAVMSRLFRRDSGPQALSLRVAEVGEPQLPAADWVKIRTIMSGVSDMDEGMFVHGDLSILGPYLTFPFIPGNENLGIVTEVGRDVRDIEPGERAVVNPLLSCRARGVRPVCPTCDSGNPSQCLNFALGLPEPGALVGGCRYTGGGWADSFIAHQSQIRPLPTRMESDQAFLAPEFARAVRVALQHAPGPGQKAVVVGAGSLGLLLLLAFKFLGVPVRGLVLAEHPHEADLARRVGALDTLLATDRPTAYEGVGDYVKAAFRRSEAGRWAMSGGADIVYETTGLKRNIEDALRFTIEGGKTVLAGINQTSGLDMSPIWLKGVHVCASGFSGDESSERGSRETLDVALDLISTHGLPSEELITDRLPMIRYPAALDALRDRASSRSVKVVFQHVV